MTINYEVFHGPLDADKLQDQVEVLLLQRPQRFKDLRRALTDEISEDRIRKALRALQKQDRLDLKRIGRTYWWGLTESRIQELTLASEVNDRA